ncbi:MAG: tocopherol cyclase family protein [Clostridia bacterium]|nr:tocopherol cyclase family protein [Clostridia bacterium]
MMYYLKRLFNPEIYQGQNRKRNYFEGWYYKTVDASGSNVMSFIPGISLGENEDDSHAFVQVIDGSRLRSGYFSYPLDAFECAQNKLELKIGENFFCRQRLELSLKNHDMSYEGALGIVDAQPFPKSLLNPGIMGPFGYLSFMECYHGVVHMYHSLSGSLKIDGDAQDFSGGTGYLEKDWGKSFPDAWVWVQSNHFEKPNTSFMLSFAHIPFLGTSFKGLIAFLYVDNICYRLSTYQGAKVNRLSFEKDVLTLIIEGRKHALGLTVRIKPGSTLKAPKNGLMIDDLIESMTSGLQLYFLEKDGKIIFQGEGRFVGVEVGGDLQKLM